MRQLLNLQNRTKRIVFVCGVALTIVVGTLYAIYEDESFIVSWTASSPQVTGGGNTAGYVGNMAVGQNNNVNGGGGYGHSAAIGYGNTLTDASGSMAIGALNHIDNHYSMAAGFGNIVPKQIGSYGISDTMPATIVGLYNEPEVGHGGEHFAFSVGIGDSASDRDNAFTVYKNGAVVIHHPSTEIPMY